MNKITKILLIFIGLVVLSPVLYGVGFGSVVFISQKVDKERCNKFFKGIDVLEIQPKEASLINNEEIKIKILPGDIKVDSGDPWASGLSCRVVQNYKIDVFENDILLFENNSKMGKNFSDKDTSLDLNIDLWGTIEDQIASYKYEEFGVVKLLHYDQGYFGDHDPYIKVSDADWTMINFQSEIAKNKQLNRSDSFSKKIIGINYQGNGDITLTIDLVGNSWGRDNSSKHDIKLFEKVWEIQN